MAQAGQTEGARRKRHDPRGPLDRPPTRALRQSALSSRRTEPRRAWIRGDSSRREPDRDTQPRWRPRRPGTATGGRIRARPDEGGPARPGRACAGSSEARRPTRAGALATTMAARSPVDGGRRAAARPASRRPVVLGAPRTRRARRSVRRRPGRRSIRRRRDAGRATAADDERRRRPAVATTASSVEPIALDRSNSDARGGGSDAIGAEDRADQHPASRRQHRGLSDWERWLEMCARIDGFPRHLSIHSGGMLVTAAPLIDIAPLERATMADRVVVQYDKRDVETMKLIKLDLLGPGDARRDRRDAPAHRARLRRLPRPRPDARGDPRGLRDAPGGRHRGRVPGREPGPDADAARSRARRASTTSSWRSRSSGPGPIQGNAVHPYLRRKQGLEPVTYLHPSLEPILHDTLGVILYQEQVMKIAIDVAGFTPAGSDAFRRAMGTWRSRRRWRSSTRSSSRAASASRRHAARRRRGAVPPVRGVRELRVREVAMRRRSRGPPTSRRS